MKAVALVVVGAAAAAAQSPVFRAGTTLIEFTAIAVDSRGEPVPDLRKDEIAIAEDGTTREVAFFHFEGAPPSVVHPAPLEAGVFTNRSEYSPGPARNLTAIVLDAINTTPNGQRLAGSQVLRYLRTVPDGSRIAVYRIGRQLAVLHDFTEDIESLRARVAKNQIEVETRKGDRGGDFLGLMEATSDERRQAMAEMAEVESRALSYYNDGLKDRRLASTIAALEALGNHLAGIPGRKNLVWISEGLPMIRWADRFQTIDDDVMRRTARRLATQGIALYPVDARGVTVWASNVDSLAGGSTRGQRPPPIQAYNAPSREQQNYWSAMDLWAQVTGGRVVKLTNDPSQGVVFAAADVRAAYSLGFYATGEPDNRWHELRVTVKRRGVRLRHPLGYVSAATSRDAAEPWTPAEWSEVAYSPLGSTAIRLDARCELTADTLTFALQIAGSDLFFRRTGDVWTANLDVAVAEKTSSGPSKIRQEESWIRITGGSGDDPRATAVQFATQWKLDARTTRVRLIVRDRSTGRYGTLDIPLNRLTKS